MLQSVNNMHYQKRYLNSSTTIFYLFFVDFSCRWTRLETATNCHFKSHFSRDETYQYSFFVDIHSVNCKRNAISTRDCMFDLVKSNRKTFFFQRCLYRYKSCSNYHKRRIFKSWSTRTFFRRIVWNISNNSKRDCSWRTFRISFIDYMIFSCNVDLMNNNHKFFVILQCRRDVSFFRNLL